VTIEPKPMDPDRLARLIAEVEDEIYVEPALVFELLADRAWHRARVEVTDEDIANSDVDEADPRFYAWMTRQHQLPDLADGRWSGDPGHPSSIILDYLDAETANAAARGVGKPPLDVLDEIAATEVPNG